MKDWLLALLRDPVDGSSLELAGSEVVSAAGRRYPVRNDIPRFVTFDDAGQEQTADSFGFKWQQRSTYESDEVRTHSQNWLIERYGFHDLADMERWFATRECILDAGCGGGLSASLMLGNTPAQYVGADIAVAVDEAKTTLANLPNAAFVQADMLALPFAEGTFDTIIAEGTLHHTPSTERALSAVTRLLRHGGEILFYVYRTKAPAREFTDDHVRAIVSPMPPAEAWEALRPLTALGRAFANLHATITIDEDVPYLGVKAGTYDVQRFLYGHFCKMFWNESMSFDENHHVNFDWFHPRYAHRQTEADVERWCERLGLETVHRNVQESGITIRAVRR